MNLDKINGIITLDVDWAPDFVIDYVSEKLEKNNIKATWFITHNSKSIKKLFSNPNFEVGIHPNFKNNSTQGKNIDDILRNLKKIAPKSKSLRTHGLLQSTEILLKFKKYGIKNDLSILMSNYEGLKPHYEKFLDLVRFPYYWEDDVEVTNKSKFTNVKKHLSKKGLKIFNFHPIHIYLNTEDLDRYEKIKNSLSKISKKELDKHRNPDLGTEVFFDNLLNELKKKKTYKISEITKIMRIHEK